MLNKIYPELIQVNMNCHIINTLFQQHSKNCEKYVLGKQKISKLGSELRVSLNTTRHILTYFYIDDGNVSAH